MSAWDDFVPVHPIDVEAARATFPTAPPALIDLWRTRGAGFASRGRIRIIDPRMIAEGMTEWFEDGEDAIPFAATSLGDLIVWRRGRAWFASPRQGVVRSLRGSAEELVAVLPEPGFGAVVLATHATGPAPEVGWNQVAMATPLRSLGGPMGAPGSLVPLAQFWDFQTMVMGQAHFGPDVSVPTTVPPSATVGTSPMGGPELWAEVRARADAAGVPRLALILPGDDPAPAWQGALHVAQAADGWQLTTIDYGTARLIAQRASEREIADVLLERLDAPLPAALTDSPSARAQLLTGAAQFLASVRPIVAANGSMRAQIPAASLLLSRFGALDGFQLYTSDTSVEERALPPAARHEQLHEFVTGEPLLVRATITPAWFGFPGGGVRLTLEDESRDIRDLVRAGVLLRVVRS